MLEMKHVDVLYREHTPQRDASVMDVYGYTSKALTCFLLPTISMQFWMYCIFNLMDG